MKRILIVGSSGFIGKALEKKLKSDAVELLYFNSKDGDISEKHALDRFTDKGIDHVFHLAAKTFVPDSWVDPFDFYRVNFMGTVTVLEFCRLNKCRLTVTSSYLYGTPEYLPVDEKHPVTAFNPYALSKLFSEQNCAFYSDNFSVPITILRLFNVYGPGQPPQFLIPTILDQLFDAGHEIVVNDLLPRRDYVYIDDIVRALILTIDGPVGIYNVASGDSVSVEEIITTVVKHAGLAKPYRSVDVSRKNEVFELYGSAEKIRSHLGWVPQFSMESGLLECVKFCQSRRAARTQ